MKRERALALCVVGGLILLPAVRAVMSGDNPYKSIVDRNPFALVPPPPPPPPPDNTPPPSNIKLTGITTIFGIKNALLMAQEPGPGGKSQSYILTEGQREGAVEVLAIDEVTGSVKINNAGRAATLTFEHDGLKAPAAPVAPGVPPGGAIPMPGRPGMPMPVQTSAGTLIIPGAPPAAVTPGGAQPSSSGGLRQLPSRSLRMPQSSAQLNQPTTSEAASPEAQILQQVIQMHVNKEDMQKRGIPYPPMPPIPGLTEE